MKEDKTGGSCSLHGKEEKSMQSLMGKPEEKRLSGRPRNTWDDIVMVYGLDLLPLSSCAVPAKYWEGIRTDYKKSG
jgi:hypothetical protein